VHNEIERMQNDLMWCNISAPAWADWTERRKLAVTTAGRHAGFRDARSTKETLTCRMRRSSSQNFEGNGRGLLTVLHLCPEKLSKS
jgi:hypothetical protein